MCSKKCAILTFSFLYLALDVFINQCLITNFFTDLKHFILVIPAEERSSNNGNNNSNNTTDSRMGYRDLLLDQWLIANIRDLFLFIILLIVLINHHLCYKFLKFLHHKYINALLCLLMYSYAMIKLLLHADDRKTLRTNVFILIWNIIAAFLYFISLYMLSLLKVFDYKKTNVDGSEPENGGDEADIFLDTIKQTQRKRVSLFRLFSYSKADWLYILIGTVFLLGGSLAEAFVPYYTGQTLDSILVQQNFNNFKTNVGFFMLANFLSGFIGGLRMCFFSIAVARLNVRFRKLLFLNLTRQDIGFFDKTNTGDMLSRLSTDTSTMSDLIAQNLNGFLWNLVRTVGTMIFIFKLSWQLSLICFIGAPVVFAIGELYGKYYKNLSNKAAKRMADSNHVAEETLSTIRTVRSFANEDGEFKRYTQTLKDLYRLKFKQAIIFATYDWAVKLSQLFMTVSMFVYGAHLVVTKQITSGDFMSFVIYQLTLGSCLEGLTSVYTGLMSAAGAAEKVFEYLDKQPDPDLKNDYKSASIRGEIEFKNVTFSYPTRMDSCILQNVSFSVKPGEVVAIVGPSGSGKSSCLSLLERFYKPDSGEILIDGVSIRKYDHKYIHQSIAIVSQEPVLYARTVKENIAYGLDEEDVSIERTMRAAQMANAHTFIMASTDEYSTQCGERGVQLSGGQKQRIAIARALIRNPHILLLDEATSALDAESEYLVQQAIYKNLKGKTVLIVAHRLSTIESADKIIVLDSGRLVEQGTHKELIRKNGLYAHLVNKQIHSKSDEAQTPIKSGASTPKTLNNSLSYFSSIDHQPTTEF